MWFGFFVQWHINFPGLFNVIFILIDKQCGTLKPIASEYKGVQTFSKAIRPNEYICFSLLSLLHGISTFMSYFMPKTSSTSLTSLAAITDIPGSFSLHPYHLYLPLGPPEYIQCPHRAVVDTFLLVGQYWLVHVKGSIVVRNLWIHICSSSSVPHVLIVLFG